MASKPTSASKPEPRAAKPKLVAMVRDPETNPAPHTADVHPDEVENMKAGGWQEK